LRNLYSYEKSVAATTDLLFGAFKNESSPSANDGTEIVSEHMQDLYYPLYQVLLLADLQPSGELENNTTSRQFLTALANTAPFIYDDSLVYKKNSITLNAYNNEISIYQSKKDDNTSALSDTDSWNILAKIDSSGVFYNVSLNSPALTGTPTAPTAVGGTATTQIATTAFVKTAFQNFIKITSGRNTNGATIYPPTGFTMSDLAAFIPAISEIHYSGDVDNNDSTYCNYTLKDEYILLTSTTTEQRKKTFSNWIAIWIKS